MINYIERKGNRVCKTFNREDPRNQLVENHVMEYFPGIYNNFFVEHSKFCLTKLSDTGIVPKLIKYDDNSITLEYVGERVKNPDIKRVNQIARTLDERGIKHCDLHNENILEKNGKYYVIDFTLAQANGIVGLADLFQHTYNPKKKIPVETERLILAKLSDYRWDDLFEVEKDLESWLPLEASGNKGSHEKAHQIYMDMTHLLNFTLPYQRSYSDWRLKRILENLPRRLRGIDLGCSNGVMCFDLARHGYKMTGYDYDHENINFARCIEGYKRYGCVFNFDEINLDFANKMREGVYDFAVCLSMFQWVIYYQGMEKAKEILRTISRKIPILLFDVSQGDTQKSKAYHFKDAGKIRQFLLDNTEYTDIQDLGCEPGTKWQKRNLFICWRIV